MTEFSGDKDESTIEHMARYKIGKLTSNELLKMRFLLSFMIEDDFIWFSNLRPNSIYTWAQLERSFHKPFFRGEMRVNLTYLVSMRRHLGESIDNYIAHLQHMKNRCFTPIPKAKMVKMMISGLENNIRKKLVSK